MDNKKLINVGMFDEIGNYLYSYTFNKDGKLSRYVHIGEFSETYKYSDDNLIEIQCNHIDGYTSSIFGFYTNNVLSSLCKVIYNVYEDEDRLTCVLGNIKYDERGNLIEYIGSDNENIFNIYNSKNQRIYCKHKYEDGVIAYKYEYDNIGRIRKISMGEEYSTLSYKDDNRLVESVILNGKHIGTNEYITNVKIPSKGDIYTFNNMLTKNTFLNYTCIKRTSHILGYNETSEIDGYGFITKHTEDDITCNYMYNYKFY